MGDWNGLEVWGREFMRMNLKREGGNLMRGRLTEDRDANGTPYNETWGLIFLPIL